MTLWDLDLDDDQPTDDDRAYLSGLPNELPDVEWVWAELDRVWHALGLDNRRPLTEQEEAVAAFYSHPVWTMNGVFSATDPESQRHRRGIAGYLADAGIRDIADYVGGFGQLALQIVQVADASTVTIVEPFASDAARGRFAEVDRVDLVTPLDDVEVEAIVAQDVLEHVDGPIGLAIQMARHVRVGGRLIFANHFRPSIACHLPSTFHLPPSAHVSLRDACARSALPGNDRGRTPRADLRGDRTAPTPACANRRARLHGRCATAGVRPQGRPRIGQAPLEGANVRLQRARAGMSVR